MRVISLNRIKLPRIDLEILWVLTVIVGVFVFVNTQPIRPHDFWWHLAVGQEIVTTRVIPTVDIYSYTMAGTAYPSYQMFWLADAALYSIYNFGGPEVIILVQSILITVAYGILLWLCWKISKSWRIAAVSMLFAVALGINNWNVRPQTISYLIGVIYLLAIYAYRVKPRIGWLFVFPVGMLVWVNSHGSFVIGLVLIGIWFGDELWQVVYSRYMNRAKNPLKQLWASLLVLVLTSGACLINPRGLGIINYVQNLTSNSVVQDLVPEWASPSFDSLSGVIFLISLMLCAIILAISPTRPNFFQLEFFLVFGILGLRTLRGAVWFGIVMAPILAYHFSQLVKINRNNKSKEPTQAGRHIANLAILILLLLGAVVSLPWFKSSLPLPPLKAGLVSTETPLEAIEYLLSEEAPGQLFHDMGFGSYLIWAARPEYKVFVDPRIELYAPQIWGDYIAISRALPGWEEKAADYGIQTMMLNPETQPRMINALRITPGWRLVFEDLSAVIFIKEN